ncbi:histidinol-phosphate transaminase [Deinococcus sp. QL22]|uniref:aminotransferase class I/II-fold pyridoxal phosphate-dependent enzyme n=1 Tax=Deinococcus sp. QL22 TaxID=2939437 RepID=UPI0020175561|nr:histidinol-phosphate transaminase [Deinococcus sp. QL22]UQN08581.1 histidinol-phosphate aminotransferase family protein [Deinococcus sp. QL22]
MPELPPLIPRAPHGGPSSAAFTGLDFSVNANPYGPNPALLQAVRGADHAHYPDPSYSEVRGRLAAWHRVTPDQVALSVGASDLLHRLARAFLGPQDTLLSLYAPFGELARAAALGRAQVEVVPQWPERLPSTAALVYVGHPHNPTGRTLSASALHKLAEMCAATGALLIVDEAYAPFTLAPEPPRHAHVVRLLSPGKAHGLVGARPAYALAAPAVVARLDNLAPAWHLPAGTAALLAALPEAQDFLTHTLPQVARNAAALAASLAAFGTVEHHGTPYVLLHTGHAASVTAQLLSHGLRVRDCTSYGLPDYVRISTRTAADNAVLIEQLPHVLCTKGETHG